ncbi:MAG TPA: hypothetical protein H9825_13660 [Candidatus Sphingobacterium stercorigallinarum]|nr:hypothetical protein [Candidatus Sphingobacterium stercorigallinarum]
MTANTFTTLGAAAILYMLAGCHQSTNQQSNKDTVEASYQKGTFGYDLEFLKQHDSVLILSSPSGSGQILVSPKYQGKVFTSTAEGLQGASFGWVNYEAFDAPLDPHMNAYGGEDRLWLGPEGGPFSLYFAEGEEMVYENWKTPAAIDTEAWILHTHTDRSASMTKDAEMTNYAGTVLNMGLKRDIEMLSREQIESDLNIRLNEHIKPVGFTTKNSITNLGDAAWTAETGAPCLWSLDMFLPTDSTVILVPYQEKGEGEVATTDYFGEIEAHRIHYDDGMLYFKADGKSRGKLGLSPHRAKAFAGSYDLGTGVLTVTTFTLDPEATYLNQEWTTAKDPFKGDAVNAYNDGPLADGGQMGPFYEIESVSPAAFLAPQESLAHVHNVYHFAGDKKEVASLLEQIFNIQVADIQSAL